MYEFTYTIETGFSGNVRFFADSSEAALAKAKEWNPEADFSLVGFWAVA